MVESALFFVIGFLCAAMLAIFAAPAVSRRAMRLAIARARLQAPLSEAQARAERDALRAIHAVGIVRMEKKLAAAEWDRAIAKTDLARQTNQLLKIDDHARALAEEIRDRDERIEAVTADGRAMEVASAAKDLALWDLTAQRDAAQDRLGKARATILALETQVDSHRTDIAALATKIAALEAELDDLRSGKNTFGGDSVHALEERLRRSEAAREAQTLELARQMRGAAEREAALTAASRARDALAVRLEAVERRAHEAEEEVLGRVQRLTTSHAASEAALAVERAERFVLLREIDSLQERLDAALASVETVTRGDAALRLAIAKLGREIVRARSSQDDEPHGEAQIVSFARREPTS